MRYGTTYSIIDFVDRLIPANESELFKETLNGLKRLTRLQDDNPWVSIQATVSAGIWVYYKGSKYCLINPAKEFLRVGAAYRNCDAAGQMETYLAKFVGSGEITEVDSVHLRQWRFPPQALPRLWEYFENLGRPQPSDLETMVGKHPRFFPSDDRVAALEEFIKGGRICPGVGRRVSPHKITEEDQIEYDHIIPYSQGGASTAWNLQILCVSCNAKKAATAA